QKALTRKCDLALELYRAHPEHEEVATLMAGRWDLFLTDPKKAAALDKEVAGVLADAKNEALLKEAAFIKATLTLRKDRTSPDVLLASIDDFIRRDPKDDRGAMLLASLVDRLPDSEMQTNLSKRLTDEYPDTSYAKDIKEIREAKGGAGTGVQAEGIGKPFDLAFIEASSGSRVTMQALKGKVVVIDFWATWCGPCVAEMPKMKALYQKYRSKGVEFIGVSLDQPRDAGGYDQLINFVESNEIPWPQYYQGNGWKSEFSAAWEVKSVPTVFLVDAEGKLADTKARGKLEDLIPRYLERAKKSPRR
ncbi:TlpA family protein disulfide reductase, partial [Singulisphaera rosea]